MMERVLSQDERIRRAEDLYERRQHENETRRNAKVNVNNGYKSIRPNKLILQCAICILIYGFFYGIKMVPNVVPKDIMYKITNVLEYDINIKELYENVSKYRIVNIEKEEIYRDNLIEEETESISSSITQENKTDNSTKNEVEELSQMELEAQHIKTNYSFIKPLEGEITSRFGERNPTVPTVPKNHTGIDIARSEGTIIIAATDGIVDLVSSEGDLR